MMCDTMICILRQVVKELNMKLICRDFIKRFNYDFVVYHMKYVDFFRLELMFERAEQWSQDLEDNYGQLDKWKRKGDSLLYSMLPRSVADQLQNEQSTMNTCKANITFTYYAPRFKYTNYYTPVF